MSVHLNVSHLFVARDGDLWVEVVGTRGACQIRSMKGMEPHYMGNVFFTLYPPIANAMIAFENLDEDQEPHVPRCICGEYCWAYHEPHITTPCSGRLFKVDEGETHYCNEHGQPPEAAFG